MAGLPRSSRWISTCSFWLLGCVLGCADRATIGALCPIGCELRARDSTCDCPVTVRMDAGSCTGNSCSEDAGQMMMDSAAADADADTEPPCPQDALLLASKQLDLLILMDSDASLMPWWLPLTQGLLAFVQDSGSRGVGVGFQRFADACDVRAYDSLVVPIDTLPANLAALQQAIPIPGVTTTSTVPVLNATLNYAKTWATNHPDRTIAVLLVTDVSPGTCDAVLGDFHAEAVRLASEAASGTPSIRTYVVGGGGLPFIEGLASAGGTVAHPISPLASGEDVLAALRTIRDYAPRCEFALPEGYALSADSRVIVTAAIGGRTSYEIQRGSSACPRSGFYVLDETRPYPVIACPSTCAELTAGASLSLSAALCTN